MCEHFLLSQLSTCHTFGRSYFPSVAVSFGSFFVALSIEVLKNDRTVSVHHLSFLSQRINVHVLVVVLFQVHMPHGIL